MKGWAIGRWPHGPCSRTSTASNSLGSRRGSAGHDALTLKARRSNRLHLWGSRRRRRWRDSGNRLQFQSRRSALLLVRLRLCRNGSCRNSRLSSTFALALWRLRGRLVVGLRVLVLLLLFCCPPLRLEGLDANGGANLKGRFLLFVLGSGVASLPLAAGHLCLSRRGLLLRGL